jgi:hypothetical protein
MSDEKVVVAKAEVQRLMDAWFIHEVWYPRWLVNVVMVKKKNSKWRTCTDLSDPNKWCSKDNFLLTRIDKVVDLVVGCETVALLDYLSGYHQIWLREEDKEKTSFITPFSTYCYLRCPKASRMPAHVFATRTTGSLRCTKGVYTETTHTC